MLLFLTMLVLFTQSFIVLLIGYRIRKFSIIIKLNNAIIISSKCSHSLGVFNFSFAVVVPSKEHLLLMILCYWIFKYRRRFSFFIAKFGIFDNSNIVVFIISFFDIETQIRPSRLTIEIDNQIIDPYS